LTTENNKKQKKTRSWKKKPDLKREQNRGVKSGHDYGIRMKQTRVLKSNKKRRMGNEPPLWKEKDERNKGLQGKGIKNGTVTSFLLGTCPPTEKKKKRENVKQVGNGHRSIRQKTEDT